MPKMTLDDIVRNAMGIHIAFWGLGFESEDIYLDGDHKEVAVILKTQGKQFTATAGPKIVDHEVFKKAWLEYLARWNAGKIPYDEVRDIYFRTGIPGHAEEFIAAVKRKGIIPPAEIDLLTYEPKAKA